MGCQETQIETILGYIALSFELIHRFPQLYKIYKTKRGDDISEWMIFAQFISLSFYVVYSILRTDVIILIGSIVPMIQDIIMYMMIRMYRKHYHHKEHLLLTI